MATRMQQRRGTAAQWAAANPVLADGEVGYEKDTGVVKIGNGTSTWNQLSSILNGSYLPVTGKAYDADRLDGLDSTSFAQKNYVDDRVLPTGASRSLVNHFGSTTAFPAAGTGFKIGDRVWRSDVYSELFYTGSAWRQTEPGRSTTAQRAAILAANNALYDGFQLFETDTGIMYTWRSATSKWVLTDTGTKQVTRIRRSAPQTFANNSWITMQFDVEDIDTEGNFTPSSTATGITIARAGMYRLSAGFAVAESVGSRRGIRLYKNGTIPLNVGSLVSWGAVASPECGVQCTGTAVLAVNDVVTAVAFQDSGGTTSSAGGGSGYAPNFLDLEFLRP